MIFLSHNFKDKPIVEQIAIKLKNVYGQQNVFYDSWSIQPGDGIIDKMNEGLTNCKFFFFFISQNSLSSEMVKLEWQNALVKAAQRAVRFIPIRMDKAELPFLLTQSLYIDLYSQGLEAATRQIIDVVQGTNTFNNPNGEFHNLVAIKKIESGKIVIECKARFYMEPISSFAFATHNNINDITYNVRNENMNESGKQENIRFENGQIANIIFISVLHATTPDIPLVVEFSSKSQLDIFAVLHKKTHQLYKPIPLVTE